MRALGIFGALAALTGCQPSAPQDGEVAPVATPAATATAGVTAAQQAYAAANARMHEGMADIPADADEAFMRGMLAHHRGAVEMAKVELEHGRDAAARDLAERVIAAQAAEIREMEAWLKAHGTPATGAPVDHAAMGH